MSMKRNALIVCLAIILSLAMASGAQAAAAETGKMNVTVTFNAIMEFAKAVGGDRVDITTIIPDGTEPHDFEPKAQDLAALSDSKVFVYNGLGMEGWVEEVIAAVNNEALIVVDASVGAELIGNTEEEPEEGYSRERGLYDPHLWLSLKSAQIQAGNIKAAFSAADPANAEYYEANYQGFAAQLQTLFDEYLVKFGTVAKKNFVTGHAAFGYLCRDFGLTQNSVEDMFAEGEPSAQQLAELVDYCRANGVTTIFAEKMASPEISETLANEVGANVITIYTIESAEDGLSYLERMEKNLNAIYLSLAQ